MIDDSDLKHQIRDDWDMSASTWVDHLDGRVTWDQLDFLLDDLADIVLPVIRSEVAKELRSAAGYFAGGLHCMDMRSTPEETVTELRQRADRAEKGEQYL